MANLKQFFSPFNFLFSFLPISEDKDGQNNTYLSDIDKCTLDTKVQTRKRLTQDAVHIEVYAPTELDAKGNPKKPSKFLLSETTIKHKL